MFRPHLFFWSFCCWLLFCHVTLLCYYTFLLHLVVSLCCFALLCHLVVAPYYLVLICCLVTLPCYHALMFFLLPHLVTSPCYHTLRYLSKVPVAPPCLLFCPCFALLLVPHIDYATLVTPLPPFCVQILEVWTSTFPL